MPYSKKIIEAINEAQPSLGTELGKWSVRRDISMMRVATVVGASRQTIYNWFTGATEVAPAYQERVTKILEVIKKTSQTQDVWRTLCLTFNIKQ